MQVKKQLNFTWTNDWFKIGNRIRQGSILSPCLFNLCSEHITGNAGLDESQAGIKIAGRNANNLRYVDDITLMAESKEKLKSLLMKVKKLAWNSTFKKLKLWHPVPLLHSILMGKKWKPWQVLFSWAPKSLWMVTLAVKLKYTCPWKKSYDKFRQHIKKQRYHFANKGPNS